MSLINWGKRTKEEILKMWCEKNSGVVLVSLVRAFFFSKGVNTINTMYFDSFLSLEATIKRKIQVPSQSMVIRYALSFVLTEM